MTAVRHDSHSATNASSPVDGVSPASSSDLDTILQNQGSLNLSLVPRVL